MGSQGDLLQSHILCYGLSQPSTHPQLYLENTAASEITTLAPRMCLNLNCGPMFLMTRAFSQSSMGLVRSALARLCSFPWHLLKQWACGRQPIGRRSLLIPVPVSTQLSLGTLELLNWRKIAFYPCRPLCPGSSLPPVHAWPELTVASNQRVSEILHFRVTMTLQISEK